MKRRIYTKEEIKLLELNPFIKSVKYYRELEYDPLFKLWVIVKRLEHPELTSKEIFELAKINTKILNHNLPRRRINEWLKNYNKFGIKYFLPEDEVYYLASHHRNDIKRYLKDRGISIE